MPTRPNAQLGITKPPREAGADLAQAMAEILAHHPRFLDDLHNVRPLFFRATVTAQQTTNGVRQVQVQRTGQALPDSAWYPIFDAGYVATVGDDVLLCYVDQRFSALVIGARTQTSPAAGGTALSTSAVGESYLPLTVTNNSSTSSIGGSVLTPVPATSTDYVVQCHLTGSTATQVWNALSDQTSFTDLKVIFGGSEIDCDIDRQTNGAWSSSNITLWFRLQRPIAASGTDQGYQLRMGGGLRSSPPRSWGNIYPFSDDFGGSSLSGSWTTTLAGASTVTVSGSLVTLTAAANQAGAQYMNALTSFGLGYATLWCAALGSTDTNRPQQAGWRNGNSSPALVAAANAATSSSVWVVFESSSGTYQTMPDALSSAQHVYTLATTSAGAAYAWRDAGAANAVTGVLAGTGQPYLETASASSPPTAASVVVADWCKVRPYVTPEPTVSAGTLQSAGGLRWEPVVDGTGSVLVDSSGNPIMALTSIS
jgi:hypothetical protein